MRARLLDVQQIFRAPSLRVFLARGWETSKLNSTFAKKSIQQFVNRRIREKQHSQESQLDMKIPVFVSDFPEASRPVD
jgi:hypothetical protein